MDEDVIICRFLLSRLRDWPLVSARHKSGLLCLSRKHSEREDKVMAKGKSAVNVFGLICLLGICILSGVRDDSAKRQETAYAVVQDVPALMYAGHDLKKESCPVVSLTEKSAAGDDLDEWQEQAVIKRPAPKRTMSDSPKRVSFREPVVKSGDLEGELSYRWPDQCIAADDTTVLITGDCFYLDGRQRQKIFFLAQIPDFELQEVYRHDYTEVPEVIENYADRYDCVNERMACPVMVPDGYVYEADGRLYHLSRDFKERDEICNLREIMGELYHLYYKGAYENTCDISTDLKKLLACTNEGLYEYDLLSGEAKLLETAVFKPHVEVRDEGDCGCAMPENDFIGPLRVEYTPDGQGYAFKTVDATEDVWGSIISVELRNEKGQTLYQRQIDEYHGDFSWLETEEQDYLAVFYEAEEETWLDLVAADTGKSETYKVPAVIFGGDSDAGDAALIDEDYLLSYYYDREKDTGSYKVYQLHEGDLPMPKQIDGKISWKVKVLAEGSDFDSVVKYPELVADESK